MGQKTHPKGFRLITTQKHLSNWYSSNRAYPSLASEDFRIRQMIEIALKNTLTISNIEISRSNYNFGIKEQINVNIRALYPRAKDIQKKIITGLEPNLKRKASSALIFAIQNETNLKDLAGRYLQQKMLELVSKYQRETKKLLSLKFELIKNPFQDATLIAKYIANQLEKRIPFRRAIKQAIKKAQYTAKKGIKIQVSGRLNGIEIARSEWKREGKIPLHTLNAHIDYTHQVAHTIYGLIGIKVWLLNESV